MAESGQQQTGHYGYRVLFTTATGTSSMLTKALQGSKDMMFYTYNVTALSYPGCRLTCAVQFKEMRSRSRAVVQHETRDRCIRDSGVGHENTARLAADNSLHVASLHSPVTESWPLQTRCRALDLLESRSTYRLSGIFLRKGGLLKHTLHHTQSTVQLDM